MTRYTRIVLSILLAGAWAGVPHPARAQLPVAEVIAQGVAKVIRALDLKVQRLENKTIVLTHQQKILCNQLSLDRLAEISSWAERRRQLLQQYYTSLWQVKDVIASATRVRQVAAMEKDITRAYVRGWAQVAADEHYTPAEKDYIRSVYSGILSQAADAAGELTGVVKDFRTSMSDAERSTRIEQVASAVRRMYGDIRRFNTENQLLSLSRARGARERASIETLYGLP